MMSSIESKLGTNQSNDQLDHRRTADDALIEPNDPSNNNDIKWWDAPIPNQLTAAYQVGRYLNLLNWHFQHILFLDRVNDRIIIADLVLARLMAVSYEFVASPPNHLYDTIGLVRDDWKMRLCSDVAVDAAAECYDDRWTSFEESTSKERRRDLVALRVRRPLVEKLRNEFFEVMTDEQKWALELGSCVDQGIRPTDISDFFEYEVTLREPERLAETNASDNESNWFIVEQKLPAFEAGEIAADSAWPITLQTLMRKGGTSTEGAIALIPSMNTSLHDRYAFLKAIERLDQGIRERLGRLNDDFAEQPGGEHDLSGQPPSEPADGHPTILSRTMTKQEAARFHSGENVSDPTVYLRRLINQGLLTPPIGDGQRWRFVVREFPKNVHDKMRRSVDIKN